MNDDDWPLADDFSDIRPFTKEERKRAMEKEIANNVIELNIPTPEEREGMQIQDEIYETFGENGLFTMQMVTAVFSDLMDRMDEIEKKLETLLGPK